MKIKRRFYGLGESLQAYDRYFLRHYPLVWRSRVHGVLPLALMAVILFFIAGYLAPNSLAEPLVHPYIGIILQEETYFVFFNLLILPLVVYWGYRQVRDHGIYHSLKEGIIQLVLYTLALTLIWAFTIPAYRWGTIYRTARLLTPEQDQLLAEHNDFLYGIILPDTLYHDIDKDIERGQRLFRERKAEEDELLYSSYENYYLDKAFSLKFTDQLDFEEVLDFLHRLDRTRLSGLSNYLENLHQLHRLNRLDRSDLSYRSYLFDLSNLSLLSNLSKISYLSYRSYRSYLFGLSDLSEVSDLSYLSYRSYRSNQSDMLNLLDLINLWDKLYHSDPLYQLGLNDLNDPPYLSGLSKKLIRAIFYEARLIATYDQQYKNEVKPHAKEFIKMFVVPNEEKSFNLKIFSDQKITNLQYNLNTIFHSIDSLNSPLPPLLVKLDAIKHNVPDLTFLHPNWYYQLKEKLNPIKHARAYLAYRIYLDYYQWLSHYLPFLILFFWIVPYLRLDQVFISSYVLLLLYFGPFYLWEEGYNLNTWACTTQLLLFLLLLIAVIGKRNHSFNDFWLAGVVVSLVFFFLLGLLCDYYIFLRYGFKLNIPTWALQSSQALALLGFLCYIYLRTLPRR